MAKPRGPLEIITENVEELPVVQAWRAADSRYAVPRQVELLRRKNKSLVYRLAGAGANGSHVIAKACVPDTAFVEDAIYNEVLPCLPVTQLRYYGSAPSPNTQFSWLFLEDARGAEFDPTNSEHRELATRWLATLHMASSSLAAPPPLPERGPPHYLEHMRQARKAIIERYDHPAFDAGERVTLDRILKLFEVAESKWSEIVALFDELPRALIHADFAERNVQIRPGTANETVATLFAFDWEMAGWGLPVVDLPHADLRLYWSLVRDQWCALDFSTLQRLFHAGRLLRGGIAATNWSVPYLATMWPETALTNLRIYDQRMTNAMREIGWAA